MRIKQHALVLSGITLALFSIQSKSAVSSKEVKAIYKTICKKNKISCPALHVINTDEVNAETSRTDIEVYTGLMKLVNTDEMALVLGHELTHWNYNDVYHVPWPITAFEARADINGAIYMSNAGYSRCNAANLFKIFYKLEGDGGRWNDVHPSNSYRYHELHRGCK